MHSKLIDIQEYLQPKKYKQVVDAATFIRIVKTKREAIESTRFILPEPGTYCYGKFEITYKYNPYVSSIQPSASTLFAPIRRKYGF
ncbi:hypothetical protein DVR12_11930 [Chitinophaga silvatica]|uniref:Uncharacterized protein n=1 Tax=Chitinophaga silvatica TaxID=2282649 RepID=A0A3E1Y9Y7_9BACT|nr:hypothetical protein [Chitinophaga silvatica]RFS22505.1 hypothetical protein DVR12_11930 [Chitinophaga silvatica]